MNNRLANTLAGILLILALLTLTACGGVHETGTLWDSAIWDQASWQ